MVAMLGWIMPEPLTMAPIRQVFPPIKNSTAPCFFTVSVVRMASAASSPPVSDRAACSAPAAEAMGSMGKTCPITPVEATITSSAWISKIPAAISHIFRALRTPSALQVLALPELQMTARACPSARFSLVTARGAPLTRFLV